MATRQSCSNDLDALFGPRVNTCLRALDFTLLFETIFLCIVPTGIFLFLATHELRSLFARESRVRSGLLHLVKLLGIATLLALDLVVFAYQFKREYTTSERLSDTYAVGAALSLGSTVVLGVLSHFEHVRSIQPSTLIISFLLVTIIFDIVRCRTLWLLGISSPLPALFTASLVAKVFVFIFETRGKKAYLPSEDQKLSPEELSSSWGQSLYLWLNGLLILGYKNIILPEQLYPMDSGMVSERIAENYRSGWRKARAEAGHGSVSRWLIYKVAIAELGWAFWYPVLPRLILMAFTFAQPFLVNTILIYLTSDEDVSSGYGLIIAFGLTYIGLSVSQSWYWYRIYRLSVMARAGLISLIYEQSLLVSSEKVDDSMALNLMGQAVDRIMLASAQVHELWATPMAVVIGVWLLSREIGYGWATLLVLSSISSVIAYFLASSMGAMQKQWLAAIQVRVHEISNMLGSMKAVKLLGLESLLKNKIDGLRHDDLTAAAKFRKILMWVVGNSHITPSLGPVAVVATYLASGATSLNTTVIFTVLTLLGLLTNPLGQLLSSLATYSAAMSCMDRIQAYLLVEKRVDYREFLEPIGSPLSSMKGSFDEKAWESKEISVTSSSVRPMITIRDASFKWKNGDFMVRNIDLTVQAGQKLAILGRIGSGKSTLLRSILGETNLDSGYIALASKRVAYCDQNVWLINGTLQQNIVSDCPFDETWYAKVIESCALAQDIAHFEDGDAVKIGSGGVKLSGGQKQRIALARALYAKPEILLLDDPFSGLDRITESLIFSRVFIDGALLSQLGVATVLVTHGVRRAKFADEVVILGPTGRIVERGTYDQLTREGEYLRSLEADEEEDHAEKEREAQVDADARENDSSRPIAAPTKSELKIELPEERLQSPKKIDRTVYKTYVNAAGKINFLIFFICEVITCVFLTFPSIWLSHWSSSSAYYQETHLPLLTGILAFGSVLGILGLLGCVYYLFLGMAYRSGETLHAKMTVAVTTAAYSYISRIDTGSLVNRFSEDIMYLDSVLPMNVVNATLDSMSVLVQVGIICAVSVWMIVALPLLFACVYIVQHYYLRTSKQLRLLDIELKAPLFTQAIETSNGLASIRAFNMQDGLLAKNLQLLDASQKPVYLLFCVQRWLQLILGLMIAGLGILVIGIAVGLRGKTNAGSVGLAMVNITVLSEVLEYAIVHYTSLETSLGAVARIADFLKTTPTEKQERPLEKVSSLWAKRGAIDFKNVSARYEYSREPILQNITMSIKAGMKVGLCGRTGSGKSSLVALLVRLLDAESGDLFVDSVALSTMPRDKVRTRINVIPQEPFFFGGTIRENLVPLYEDSGLSPSENENYRIVELLTKVGLWDKIAAQPGGLDAPLKSENFSFGERQLLCLLRAILRRRCSNILILDEAMSNVDFETDLLMQRLVAEEFKRHTVISIVHRLDYAMSFDMIAVLDHGRLVEFDRAATVIGRHELFKGLRAELEEDSEEDN